MSAGAPRISLLDTLLGRVEGAERVGVILRAARIAMLVQLALSIANGVYLYFFPRQAATDYAWRITPPVNAAYMGAGYLVGLVAGVLGLFVATRWRSVRALMWPFLILSAGMLLATLIHHDRFRWHYAPTWIWTFVYLGIPIGVVLIMRQQERNAESLPARDARLRPIVAASWPLGAVTAALGALLFITPSTFLDRWPWQLTPLLARAFGAWQLFIGCALLSCAWSLRRAHEGVIPYLSIACWSVFLLLLPLLYHDRMRTGLTWFWLWLAWQAVLLIFGGWAALTTWRLMRADGERL